MFEDFILVVDDNEGIRQLIFLILTGEGYIVELAKDGEDAINKVAIKPPSLVILDVYMPGMNGIETFKELQKIIPDTPVVFLSAYTENRTLAKGVEDGFVKNFIGKPFDLTEFLNLINKVMRKAVASAVSAVL